MAENVRSSQKTRKIAAIAAGALVIGVGATYTLASWNDSEWVWGGAGNTPGVGTDSFEVLQNTTSVFDDDTANWANRETNPGGGLTFTASAISLSPGDTIYAPVALRTDADSAAATVTLQQAVTASITPAYDQAVSDPDGDLWKSIEVSVYTESVTDPTVSPTHTCDAANISNWGPAIAGITTLDTVATATQTLLADGGSTQHYCFELHFPSTLKAGLTADSIDDLQGRTIAPAWEFKAESN
ncbi:MAG TPA: SipW-dependent-type signal peptide-containing protein [Actinomycetaceae bacterium]|nr:SipW-dependent-type signal peptide-containing protein [Actinomycetaceae bacterium]